MYEQLKRYLKLNVSISDSSLDELVEYFKPLTVKKNTILLSRGETCSKLYFVNKGSIRTYYITEQGHEKSRLIAFEGMIATSLSSFIPQQPSFEFVDALEDSELLYISYNSFHQLLNNVPEWRDFYLKLLEFAYLYQNKRIEELVTLSAGERYEILLNKHPQYTQRLSNKVIASYLDITQETLSRLKSK